MDPYELGVKIAMWWTPELEQLPDHKITLYISPDAFSKRTSEKPQAEQIAAGIQEILGPYSALLMRFTSDEKQSMVDGGQDRARYMFQARQNEFSSSKMGIVLKPGNDDRKAGCSYINGLLRFRPAVTESEEELEERLKRTFGAAGVEAYERELARARKQDRQEILPKVKIWKCCAGLDRCLQEVQRGEAPKNEEYVKKNAIDGIGGDDEIDDFRMGVMGYKEVENVIPKDYFIGERMEAFQKESIEATGAGVTDQTRLMMVAVTQAARYSKATGAGPKTFSLPRASSSRHRTVQ